MKHMGAAAVEGTNSNTVVYLNVQMVAPAGKPVKIIYQKGTD